MGEINLSGILRWFAAPDKLSPSEWAARYAYIPEHKPFGGKYDLAPTYYVAGIVDALEDPDVKEIVVIKSARVGYTTALANLLGWIADQQPSPVLLVLPNEEAGRKLIDEDLVPTLQATPRARALLSDDSTKDSIRFKGSSVHLAWSGSAASLASRSIRFAILDETDKFAAFSGKDADPISLARTRTLDWQHRGKVILGSTPTTRENHIYRCYEDCGDKRKYFVPCPHCGDFQALAFGQVRFDAPEIKAIEDKATKANFIEVNRLAFYECSHCQGRIEDKHKPSMVAGGIWLSDGQTIDRQGVVSGERPKSKQVGFHISSLYNPYVRFSQVAAQFVRSQGDTGKMMEFRNQWLGEVFENVVTRTNVENLRDQLKDAAPIGLVPKWASRLVLSADVHGIGKGVYWVLRAWGRTRSRLVAIGIVSDFAALSDILNQSLPIDGSDEMMLPTCCVIDAGYRTAEVYSWALTDQRIAPIKGASSKPNKTITLTKDATSVGNTLRIIDTDFFKDQLASQRQDKRSEINQAATEEYLRQQAAEHKVIDRKSGRFVWTTVSEGAAAHYLDCEVYSCVGADLLQVGMLPDEATTERQRDDEARLKAGRRQPQPVNTGGRSDWLKPTGSKSWL